MSVQVKVVRDGTNVRLGGATKGRPDNIVGQVDRGTFPARVQCAGEAVVEPGGTVHNNWWVYIDAPGVSGWVCATRVEGLNDPGKNDEPVPGVPTAATLFPHPDQLGHD